MNIIKYKKVSNGKYKVELDDGTSLSLYEDVILKYQLLISRKIDDSIIDDINYDNMKYDVYYVALSSIKSRMKSISDLRESLLKKEYPDNFIDEAIDKLINQGYLNDEIFVKSFINNQMVTTSNGPYKIKRELLNRNIDSNIIDDNLEIFTDEEQLIRIEKIINKKLKTNSSRGGYILRTKLFNDLINLGYDSNLINRVLNNISFENDKILAAKEYEKLKKKYSRKYSGDELERVIKEKLYLKGLIYEKDC
jgi:regulatory protein